MLDTSRSKMRWGREQTLVLGGLLLAGLFCIFRLDAAPPDNQQKASTKDGLKGKATTSAPAFPAPPKMIIVSEGSDTAEMSKIINEKIEAGWKANKVTPSRYVDDYEFIRRASLDIIGRIATPAEIKAYIKDPQEKRRSMLIERLLKHEDYARHWGNLWSNWLLTRSGVFGRGKYHDSMTYWLEQQFALNKSYAEIATKLLTASGDNETNGATNFILAHLGERVPPAKEKEQGQYEMVPLTSRITRSFPWHPGSMCPVPRASVFQQSQAGVVLGHQRVSPPGETRWSGRDAPSDGAAPET